MYASLALIVAVFAPLPTLVTSIKGRVTPFRAVVNGIVAGAVGALIVMVIAQITGVNVFEQLSEQTELAAQTIASTPEMAEAIGGSGLSEAEIVKGITDIYSTVIQSLPTTICIVAAIASYIEYIILSKIYKPGGVKAIPMTKMRELELPRNIVTIWVVLYIVSLFVKGNDGLDFDFVFLNITAIFNMLFILQGMSLIFMLCYAKRLPKALAVIVIILLLGMNIGNLILELAGFADVLFGFKQRMKQKAA